MDEVEEVQEDGHFLLDERSRRAQVDAPLQPLEAGLAPIERDELAIRDEVGRTRGRVRCGALER